MEELKEEYKRVCTLRKTIEKSLEKAPEGNLWINSTKGRKPLFYRHRKNTAKDDKFKKKSYLTTDRMELVKELAQKGYDEKALEWAVKTERRIEYLMDCYEHNTLEIIYNSLSDIRRELVEPYYKPDEVFINEWLTKWVVERNTFEKKGDILTERGEKVRSKSEKIIADKLYKEGVPYVYEPEIVLDDGERVYPDFAALNVRLRREYLFEHFGKMDDPGYCRKNIRKIEDYSRSGYTFGDGLLATFETKDRMFDPGYLDALVNQYLK